MYETSGARRKKEERGPCEFWPLVRPSQGQGQTHDKSGRGGPHTATSFAAKRDDAQRMWENAFQPYREEGRPEALWLGAKSLRNSLRSLARERHA